MGHGGHSIVARGLYHLQLLPWVQNFDEMQLLVLELGDLKGGKAAVAARRRYKQLPRPFLLLGWRCLGLFI